MPNNIRKLRKQKQLTLEVLGKRVGVDKNTIRKLEVGRMQLTDRYIHLLTDALDCNAIDLLQSDEYQALYIKGHIKMGEPRTSLLWREADWLPEQLPRSTRFEGAHKFIIEDRDTGALFVCIDDEEYLRTLQVGKRYIAEIKQQDGPLFVSVVTVQEGHDGHLNLRSDAGNGHIPALIPITDIRAKIVARIIRSVIDE